MSQLDPSQLPAHHDFASNASAEEWARAAELVKLISEAKNKGEALGKLVAYRFWTRAEAAEELISKGKVLAPIDPTEEMIAAAMAAGASADFANHYKAAIEVLRPSNSKK